MTTNTGHKHISKIKDSYVVSLPPDVSIKNGGTQRIQRNSLSKAIYMRNLAFGYDPDRGIQPDFTPLTLPPIGTDRIRFGAIADTHLCNTQEALQELHNYYNEVRDLGVKHVFVAGNWVDGDKIKNSVHTWGMRNQIDYFVKNFPEVEGITTYILDGDDHEGWWHQDTGLYPGEILASRQEQFGRDDFVYLGYMERDITFPVRDRPVKLKVMHGGGGSAYAASHATQKVIDKTFTPDEIPDILILGHYHKADFLPNYRGCYAFQPGTFCWQTSFMRKKSLAAFVGGWVVDVRRDVRNQLRVSGEYLKYPARPWVYNTNPLSLPVGLNSEMD